MSYKHKKADSADEEGSDSDDDLLDDGPTQE